MTHDTLDRLGEISVPTLVLAGELDIASPPRFGRVVADGIPNARFEVLAGEAHTLPGEPGRVKRSRRLFWREVESMS